MNESKKKDERHGKELPDRGMENIQLVDMHPSGAVEIRVSIKANPTADNDQASPKLILREVELSSRSPGGSGKMLEMSKSPMEMSKKKKHLNLRRYPYDRSFHDKTSRTPSSRTKRPHQKLGKSLRTEPGDEELGLPKELLINKPETMGLSCGVRCVKWAVFTFNFLTFALGIALIGLSLSVLFSDAFKSYLQELVGKSGTDVNFGQFTIVLYVVAGVGGLLALCGFLGCCGACCENRFLLGTFFTVMLILFVATIVGAVYILAKKDEFHHFIDDTLLKYGVEKYYVNPDTKSLMDRMQNDLQCCGARGCADYANPPESCHCENNKFVQGCGDYLFSLVLNQAQIIAGILFGTLALELLAMLFTCMLYQGIGRYVRYERSYLSRT
uniref:Tetraspanin n=1 Tax=Trichuris muris TaxID=70415 RepID=A0A5S6QYI7_TRIMR